MAHAGGRPPTWKSVEGMQEVIDNYFEKCKGELLLDAEGLPRLNKYDEPIYLGSKPPTVTGLALALGFNSRVSLLEYQEKDEFVNTITRAKSLVEEYAESRLFDKEGSNGAKFSLSNNFRVWKEQQQIDLGNANDQPFKIELSTPEAKLEALKELLSIETE